MTAYYNEHDPKAAAWLRELINQGHIAPGEVDERSIEDVRPVDIAGFTQCHFFAGIGVWSYAARRAGWSDDRPLWTGSCPCQPFSAAGKGGGFTDERHLWPAFHWLIEQCRPGVVIGEQVASKDGLAWLDLVSADMEASRYAFGALDICAAGVGAPHIRQRSWWCGLADTDSAGREPGGPPATAARYGGAFEPDGGDMRPGPTNGFWANADWLGCRDGKWRAVEPGTFPLAHGAPARVGRLRGYGNAIVAPAARAFIEAVMEVA